ncbi:MAG: serine hydrolase domain-containing protein [Parvularculaceae bacterium]
MKRLFALFAASLALATSAAGAAFAQAEIVREAMQATLDRLVEENDFPGIQAAALLPDGTLVEAAAGLADRESGRAMTSDLRLASGSIGKTYVAAAVLAHVAEGALDLDARVVAYIGDEDWFQGFPNGEIMTLGQLLNHSSGIGEDYLTRPEVLEPFTQTFGDGPDLADLGVSHEDLVRSLAGQPPQFAPGGGFGYSDAAYAVAALIAEKVDGRTIEAQISERFLDPLGLSHTQAFEREMDNFVSAYAPAPIAEAFGGVPLKSVVDGDFQFDPRFEWGGGGYVANAGDLARWARAWFGGRAVDADYVELFEEWANPTGVPQLGDAYAIGVQIERDSAYGRRLFHGGYQLGFIAQMEYLPDHDIASAIMINTVDGGYIAYHDAVRDAVMAALGLD